VTLSPTSPASPATHAAATAWLARLDPALAPLPREVRRGVNGPGRLHDVWWTPGERCRLAYRTGPADAGGFVAVDTDRTGCRVYDYRDDAGLPGVVPATDPTLVARQLAPVVDGTVRGCRVQPVRYRPGARCVLRYDADTDAGTASFYAKILRPEQFPALAATRRGLTVAPGVAGSVPRLVAVWPGAHAVLEIAVDGPALSTLLADPQAPPQRCARLGLDLGRLLARFHAETGVSAPAWSPGDQIDALRRSLPPVLHADAALGARLGAAVDVLAAVASGPQPCVLAHGAFRTGQVVAGTAGLVVLDTDGVCRCDAGRDLGSAAAYLAWQALRQPHRRAHLAAAGRALLAGYREGGRAEPPTLGWWRAACLLQVAARRYRRLESGGWPLVPSLVDAAEDELTGLLASRADPLDASEGTVLADAPGRRSVARFTVHGPAGAGVPVVGKRFADAQRARLLHEHLRLLHAGPFRNGRYVVPEPLRLVPEQHLVLYRASDGDPLDRMRGGALAAGVRDAARWLARLHTCDVALPRGFSPAHEAEACDAFAAAVARSYPRIGARARLLAHRWRAAACDAATGANRPAVPIHHDFHPGHVLVGARVCVIDLDEARLGDPVFDVAHFCAYLELLGEPGDAAARDGAPHGTRLCEAFVGEYAAAGGPPVEAGYTLFRAYTWLKIAKQWAVGSGPGRDASPAQRRAGAAGALARAERCLPG
jgi:aminoglycoside phosphotransferase (APT) family kinase protein